MSYSKTTLIRRIRDKVGEQAWYDSVTSSPTTTGTALTVADTTKWAVGDVLEFQEDGDRCRVTALTNATTLAVSRGYLSDTPGTGTAHTGPQLVVKRPVFAYAKIVESISTVIDELWPHVYALVTADLTPSQTSGGWYSVASTFEDLSGAYQLGTGTTPQLFSYGGRRSDHPIDLVRRQANNVPTTGTTGNFVYIPLHWNMTNTIRVNGIRRLTDSVTTGNYDDFSAGVEVACIINFVVADLLRGTDVGRTSNRDIAQYDSLVVPMRKTQLADAWRREGVRDRHRWKDELRKTLPRMQTFRQGMD